VLLQLDAKLYLWETGGLVSCFSRSTSGYTQTSADIAKKECSCGNWQLYKYPCACAKAVAVKQGLRPEQFVQANCHGSYYICAEVLEEIAGRLKTILAPTSQQLRTVRKSYNYARDIPVLSHKCTVYCSNKRLLFAGQCY
jgi:hypothetical protein